MKTKLLFPSLLLLGATSMMAQETVPAEVAPTETTTPKTSMEVYGFAMVDAGYHTGQVNPQWYDVARPSRLPAYSNQYGADGNVYLSARQSRFGVKTATDTKLGELTTVFDFDMYGVGVDAGQTTIRLRHAYGQLGHFGAGQTESAFMDADVFPNTLEYWGPCGMLFFRNVQVRWIPILGPTHLVFALEMPGASPDGGVYQDFINTGHSLTPSYKMPDISGHYRYAADWGHVQLGGIGRYIGWHDNTTGPTNLSDNVFGWGGSLSSNLNLGKKDVVRLQGVYGAGIQNYFNDAPVDVATEINTGSNAIDVPFVGVALPALGITAFLDHNWSDKFSSSIGYSSTTITNSNGQADDAYKMGQYIAANFLYYPVPNVMMGIEATYIDRQNYKDGFTSSSTRINLSFKYNFSHKMHL